MSLRIALVAPTYPPDRCGVGDHTGMLAQTLAESGAQVDVYTSSGAPRAEQTGLTVHPVVASWSVGGMIVLAHRIALARPDVVLIQYVPTLYVRRGMSFAAPLLAWFLRRYGLRVVTVVHEPFVPLWRNVTDTLRGIVQRVALVIMVLGSTRSVFTTQFWTHQMQSWLPWRRQDIYRVVVGSNLPLVALEASDRVRLRQEMGATPDDIVVVFFGSLHGSKRIELILKTMERLRATGLPAFLLVIGQGQDELARLGDAPLLPVHIMYCTGYVDAAQASGYLQCGDLFAYPTVDGISTRRTSAIAALQHGLPVVATSGLLTEHEIFDGSVAMSDVGDDEAFIALMVALAGDVERRKNLSDRGRALEQRCFSWPSIVRQIVDSQHQEPSSSW